MTGDGVANDSAALVSPLFADADGVECVEGAGSCGFKSAIDSSEDDSADASRRVEEEEDERVSLKTLR